MSAIQKVVLGLLLLIPVTFVALVMPNLLGTGPGSGNGSGGADGTRDAAAGRSEVAGVVATAAIPILGEQPSRPVRGAVNSTPGPAPTSDPAQARPTPTTVASAVATTTTTRSAGAPSAPPTTTPEPARTAAPAATSTSVPAAVPTAVPAQPTLPPGVSTEALRPEAPADTVRGFYQLVEQHDFDRALGLWSPNMQATYSPQQNLYERFAQTQRMAIQKAEVVSVDQAAGRATVAVEVVEAYGQPTAQRRFVGTWELVRGPSGWLLDAPRF